MNHNKFKKLSYLVPVLLLAMVSLAFVMPQPDLLRKLETNLTSWRTQYAPEAGNPPDQLAHPVRAREGIPAPG